MRRIIATYIRFEVSQTGIISRLAYETPRQMESEPAEKHDGLPDHSLVSDQQALIRVRPLELVHD